MHLTGMFNALADPNRQALLDVLRADDGRTRGELCTYVPHMTRFGVMKHLAVLAAAGLVMTHKLDFPHLHGRADQDSLGATTAC